MQFLRLVHVGCISILSLSVLSSCGQGKKVIEDISITQSLQDQNLWVEMDTTLASAGFILPSLVLPLRDPQRPERNLGEVQTSPDHIIIKVNVTEATKLPIADGNRLPNGTSLPIVLNGAQVIGIPMAGSHSMVYVALSGEQLMLGAAIGIRELSSGSAPLNIFLPVQISNSISGLGGMYFGNESGVGIFALHAKIGSPQAPMPLAQKSLAKSSRVSWSARIPMALNASELTRKKIEKLRNRTAGMSGLVSID